MVLRWVILSISSLSSRLTLSHVISGERGQVLSECG